MKKYLTIIKTFWQRALTYRFEVLMYRIGEIGEIYDGDLGNLIKRYDPFKLLKVTFNGNSVKESFMEKFGAIEEFDPYHCVIKVPCNEAKNRAAALLSSSIPVDDILIDEMEIDSVIREIFKSN